MPKRQRRQEKERISSKSIPKNSHRRCLERHLKPATERRPTNVGKNQNRCPFSRRTSVTRLRHPRIAPGSTA